MKRNTQVRKVWEYSYVIKFTTFITLKSFYFVVKFILHFPLKGTKIYTYFKFIFIGKKSNKLREIIKKLTQYLYL